RFFANSGMELVQQRVQSMSEADLERQLWFIHGSFATLARQGGFVDPAPVEVAPAAVASRDELLSAAKAVGDRLGELAIRTSGEASWLGLLISKGDNWRVGPLGLDLYNGLPGIALFLAYLGEIAGESRYTELARSTQATIRRQRPLEPVQSVGA